MAIEQVKDFFKKFNMEEKIMEFDTSSATVELAAQALNVIPARIAKTLAFKKDNSCILIVTSGDVKIDNPKFKSVFEIKAKMPSAEEVLSLTGHAAGGVCPFAVSENIPVYLDISLKRFDTVFPACGSSNSAIELTCDELSRYSDAEKWIDVCKNKE